MKRTLPNHPFLYAFVLRPTQDEGFSFTCTLAHASLGVACKATNNVVNPIFSNMTSIKAQGEWGCWTLTKSGNFVMSAYLRWMGLRCSCEYGMPYKMEFLHSNWSALSNVSHYLIPIGHATYYQSFYPTIRTETCFLLDKVQICRYCFRCWCHRSDQRRSVQL